MNDTLTPALPILVVDDEEMTLKSCEVALLSSGLDNIICIQDSRQVAGVLKDHKIGVILLDLTMPNISGEDLLHTISQEYPEIPIIIITGANDVETAVKCMRNGAFDYMVKPIEKSRMISGVHRAIELKDLRQENILLKKRILSDELEDPGAFREIITRSKSMKSIFRYVEAISKTQQPVLITGETGVGKELMARAIHQLGSSRKPFVPINVAGLDDNVFSDALFGHKKGAFTGADQTRSGLVEKASRGILFLDEIGDLSLASQVKLLRLLQEKEYFPLGSDLAKRADTRIIVATNQNLLERLESGRFRKDLYYRLRTHHVDIPPLRDRLEDLPVLVDYFLEQGSEALGRKIPAYPRELITLLSTYHFPGNIRELKSMIFDAVSKHKSRMLSMVTFRSIISPGDPSPRESPAEGAGEEKPNLQFSDKLPSIKEAGDMLIDEALKRARGNQTIAAGLLGITQQALSKRLRKRREEKEPPEGSQI